jgi:putative NADH-flavin reductase
MESVDKKNVFLIGGTGRTGILVAEGALADGHQVTAFVRREPKEAGVLSVTAAIQGTGSSQELYSGDAAAEESKVPPQTTTIGPHPNLNVVVGTFDEETLTTAMKGHDMVVAILGGWPKPDEAKVSIYSGPANAYIPAMKANNITRFFSVFGAGFLGEAEKIPKDWADSENAELNVINKIRRDMRVVWDLVQEASLDFTIWCPANFPSGPRSSEYTIGINKFVGPEVTTGMIADSMVKELNENKLSMVRVGIAAAKK